MEGEGRAKIQSKCSLTVKLRSARIQDSSLDETTRKPGLPRVPPGQVVPALDCSRERASLVTSLFQSPSVE